MFDLIDEFFVGAAYRRVLGRPADPAGYRAYLHRLRTGLSRTGLLAELLASAEARARPPVAAWDAGTDRHLQALALAWFPTALGARADPRPLVARGAGEIAALPPLLASEARQALQAAWPRRLANVGRRLASTLPQGRPVPDPAWSGAAMPGFDGLPPAGGPPADEAVVPGPGTELVFTIAAANYLPYVRSLMESARAQLPGHRRMLFLVDAPATPLDEPLFDVVPASALGIPSFADMTLRYDILELATAVKPFCFEWLFKSGAQRAIYLDPDIRLYAPLGSVQRRLDDGASVVLTPHALAPLDAARGTPNDHHFLRTGVFNLGFVAMRDCAESRAFVAWWGRHLLTDSRVDFADHLFTDQRWCDLAPCLLDHLAVLRDPACNVAYWNVEQRRLQRGPDGQWTVHGQPLAFFHFSGLVAGDPEVLSRHQDRLVWDDCPGLRDLFDAYRDSLRRHGAGIPAAAPAYDSADGLPLAPVLRRWYRSRHPQPLPGLPRDRLVERLWRALLPPGPPDRASELMLFVHASQPGLAAHFDLDRPTGRHAFVGWYHAAGVHELGIAHTLTGLAGRRSRAGRAAAD